jgi:hypothetical protein
MKTRDSGHDRALHEFTIEDHGIVVGARLQPAEQLSTGVLTRGTGARPRGKPAPSRRRPKAKR